MGVNGNDWSDEDGQRICAFFTKEQRTVVQKGEGKRRGAFACVC